MIKRNLIIFVFFLSLISSTQLLHVFSNHAELSFTNLENEQDNVKNYTNNVRLVYFYLPNCPYCVTQLNALKQIDQDFNILIFALHGNENQATLETVQGYRDYHNISHDWIHGIASSDSVQQFKIRFVPSIIIYDIEGYIVAKIQEEASYETIKIKLEYAINRDFDNYSDEFFTSNNNDIFILILGIGILAIFFVSYFMIKKKLSKTDNIAIFMEEEEMKDKP